MSSWEKGRGRCRGWSSGPFRLTFVVNLCMIWCMIYLLYDASRFVLYRWLAFTEMRLHMSVYASGIQAMINTRVWCYIITMNPNNVMSQPSPAGFVLRACKCRSAFPRLSL